MNPSATSPNPSNPEEPTPPTMNKSLLLAYNSVQSMAATTIRTLPYILVALLVFALFYVASKGVRRLVTRLTHQRSQHYAAALVLGRLAEGALILLGVLVGLIIAIPSFKPAQLISLLGIGSVAIGFAFRDILQNFLAGILILLTQPFQVDDQVVIGNFEGTVERIETRATILRTYDGRRVVIPNATVFNDSVIVNTAFPNRRLQVDIGIGYGDNIDSTRTLILQTMNTIPTVLKDPAPEALVIAIADYSVNLRVRWWIDPPRKRDTFVSTDQVLTAIKNELTAAGIDLPFPTRQILFHDQTEATDGNRATQREGWPSKHGEPTTPAREAVLKSPKVEPPSSQP